MSSVRWLPFFFTFLKFALLSHFLDLRYGESDQRTFFVQLVPSSRSSPMFIKILNSIFIQLTIYLDLEYVYRCEPRPTDWPTHLVTRFLRKKLRMANLPRLATGLRNVKVALLTDEHEWYRSFSIFYFHTPIYLGPVLIVWSTIVANCFRYAGMK